MRPDLLAIVKRAKQLGLEVSINTNGLLLDRFSSALLEGGVDQITVSLDGATADTNDMIRGKGTFKRIVTNLDSLVKQIRQTGAPMTTGIAFTMTRLNLQEIPAMLNLALSLEVDVLDVMELYVSATTCGNCEHATLCRPCPFIHYNDAVIEECEAVRLRLKQFEESVLGSTPRVPAEVEWRVCGGTVDVARKGEPYRQLTGAGGDLWHQLTAGSGFRLSDLVDHLLRHYDDMPNRRQVEIDVIDFMWNLSDLGLVELT